MKQVATKLVAQLRRVHNYLLRSRLMFLSVVFVVGIALGIGAKIIAEQTVIIGFEDYLIDTTTPYIDLNAVAARVR